MKKRFAVLALTGVMAVTSLAGCGKLKDTDVVATVKGDEITADVANFYARYTQAQYETYYSAYMGEEMWNSNISEDETYEESVKAEILNSLEKMYLLEDHMKDYKISLTDEEKKVIKQTADDFDEANGLDEKNKVSGSKKTVERVLTLLTIQEKMTEAIQAGVDTEVSDEEAAQKKMQYVLFSFKKQDEDGNSVDLTEDEKTALKEQADTFSAGVKDAEDFSAYATEQGLEASDATFSASTTSLPEELVKAADALGEGETTEVVEGSNGYYVAKLVSSFDQEATDKEKENIISQRKQDLYTETTDKWLKKADVKVKKRVWAKIDFNKLSVTMKQEEQAAEEGTETENTDTGNTDAGNTDTAE